MKVIFTNHAKERMAKRNVKVADVYEALKKGHVKKNDNGMYVRNFVANEKKYPLHVGFAFRNNDVVVMTVIWKGKPD